MLYVNLSVRLVLVLCVVLTSIVLILLQIVWKDFMANLDSTSAIVRRASASILVGVAKYSKNPPGMTTQLLASVIGKLHRVTIM